MINITLNIDGLSTTGQASAPKFDKSKLEHILTREMKETQLRIISDLEKGQGANSALRAYKPPYAHAIQRGEVFGYDGTRKTSTTPNLKITGLFHRSMTLKPIKNGCELIFAGTHPFGKNGPKKGVNRLDTDPRTHKRFKARVGRLKSSGKAGGMITNQDLAGHLHGLGFVGWFQFSERDIARIVASVMGFIEDSMKNLIVPK